MLCRDWKGRVKGRDWYDFVWYVSLDTPLHLSHLDARMLQSGHKKRTETLTPELFRELIKDRIDALDVSSAKDDVVRFLRNPGDTAIWSKSFFIAVAEKIKCV